MDRIEINDDDLTVERRVTAVFRVVLGAIGLSLMGVPYALLVRPQWPLEPGWPLAITSLIALGALAVGCLFAIAALFALETRTRIAFSDDRVEFAERGLFGDWRRTQMRLRDVVAVRIELDEWTDGAADHRVYLVLREGMRRLLYRAADADGAERCANAVRLWVHPPSI